MGGDDRTAQIRHNLAALEQRLSDACAAARRPRADVTLIAITKTFPADDVRRLADLGVRDIGENRDQEAAPKAASLRDVDVTWHFVGQLQTNKCRSVLRYADVVHSVDRPHLITALTQAAEQAGRSLDVFVQVSLDASPGRGGCAPDDVARLADLVAAASQLHLCGVMAVAPQDEDPLAAFGRLGDIATRLQRSHPHAVSISAGMSGDLEAAISSGATHVRVGTALLGGRAPVVR